VRKLGRAPALFIRGCEDASVKFNPGRTILDKINGTSEPPLPHPSHLNDAKMARFQLLLRAFIIALGGKGVNCSFLFCQGLQPSAEQLSDC